MIAEATRRYAADQGRADATCRLRFGAYYWAEDVSQQTPQPDPTATGDDRDDA